MTIRKNSAPTLQAAITTIKDMLPALPEAIVDLLRIHREDAKLSDNFTLAQKMLTLDENDVWAKEKIEETKRMWAIGAPTEKSNSVAAAMSPNGLERKTADKKPYMERNKTAIANNQAVIDEVRKSINVVVRNPKAHTIDCGALWPYVWALTARTPC